MESKAELRARQRPEATPLLRRQRRPRRPCDPGGPESPMRRRSLAAPGLQAPCHAAGTMILHWQRAIKDRGSFLPLQELSGGREPDPAAIGIT